MKNRDIELTCIQCGEKFTFTKSEQIQWARKGLMHQPKRCRKCREERRKKIQNYNHEWNDGLYSNIYRAPAFRNEEKDHKVIYRSPMESAKYVLKGYDIICKKCGEPDVLPFKPYPGRDVYCHNCYEEIKKLESVRKRDKSENKKNQGLNDTKDDKDENKMRELENKLDKPDDKNND